MADVSPDRGDIPRKAPHRSVDMGQDMGRVGETVQSQKSTTDEIFASVGWKQLTYEEAQKAYEVKAHIFAVYDPMETVFSKGDSPRSARIIAKLEGRNSPNDFNHFKTIKYYLEETE